MDKKKEFHNMKSSSLVTPLGFKPTTFRTEIRRFIQLSYGALQWYKGNYN